MTVVCSPVVLGLRRSRTETQKRETRGTSVCKRRLALNCGAFFCSSSSCCRPWSSVFTACRRRRDRWHNVVYREWESCFMNLKYFCQHEVVSDESVGTKVLFRINTTNKYFIFTLQDSSFKYTILTIRN